MPCCWIRHGRTRSKRPGYGRQAAVIIVRSPDLNFVQRNGRKVLHFCSVSMRNLESAVSAPPRFGSTPVACSGIVTDSYGGDRGDAEDLTYRAEGTVVESTRDEAVNGVARGDWIWLLLSVTERIAPTLPQRQARPGTSRNSDASQVTVARQHASFSPAPASRKLM